MDILKLYQSYEQTFGAEAPTRLLVELRSPDYATPELDTLRQHLTNALAQRCINVLIATRNIDNDPVDDWMTNPTKAMQKCADDVLAYLRIWQHSENIAQAPIANE